MYLIYVMICRLLPGIATRERFVKIIIKKSLHKRHPICSIRNTTSAIINLVVILSGRINRTDTKQKEH